MSSQNYESSRLLAELQRLVEANEMDANIPSYVDDPDYIEHFQQFHQIFARDEYSKKINFFVEKINIVLSRKDQGHVFRLCSIGCGDGHLDGDILSTLTRGNPDIQIQYAGIDISKTFCKIAQENLKPRKNVNVKIHNQDFMDFTDEPFDVIIASHSLYYFNSPGLAVKKALGLTNKNGLVLANLRPDDAFSKPTGIMCKNLSSSTKLTEALKNLGVQFTEESYTYTMDFTTCFEDNFQQPEQKNVLDFLVHLKLKFFPEKVTTTLIAYLNSISTGKPERKLLDLDVSCFCISH